MKFFAALIVCLALAVSPCLANPFFNPFEVIGKGIESAGNVAKGVINGAGQAASDASNAANGLAQVAINTATQVGNGVVNAKVTGLSYLNNLTATAAKNIGQAMEGIRNAALKATIKRVQETIQKISDGTQHLIATGEQAGDKFRDHIINVEDKLEDKLQTWSDSAKEKLAGADDETQQAGEKLIDELTSQRTEELKECTDKILSELEELQEQANATAKKYRGPTQELIATIGDCESQSAAKCSRAVAEKLKPLTSAPGELAALKLKVDKAVITNIQRNVCIGSVMSRFKIDSKRVEANLEILMKGVTTTTTDSTSTVNSDDGTIYDMVSEGNSDSHSDESGSDSDDSDE